MRSAVDAPLHQSKRPLSDVDSPDRAQESAEDILPALLLIAVPFALLEAEVLEAGPEDGQEQGEPARIVIPAVGAEDGPEDLVLMPIPGCPAPHALQDFLPPAIATQGGIPGLEQFEHGGVAVPADLRLELLAFRILLLLHLALVSGASLQFPR